VTEYDQLTRDLAHKAADDACAAIYRTAALHDDLASKSMIATMAAGQTLAIACTFLASKVGGRASQNPDTVVDALWAMLRPITLDAMLAARRADHAPE
jgi:hypothetical protein